jgi:hypothetical protein
LDSKLAETVDVLRTDVTKQDSFPKRLQGNAFVNVEDICQEL